MNILAQLLLSLGTPAFEGLLVRFGLPRLVFGEPFIDIRQYLTSVKNTSEFHEHNPSGGTIPSSHFNVLRKKGQITHENYSVGAFIHIPIHNQQKSRIHESTAKSVFAKLLFFTLDGYPIGSGREFDGRWENTRQPSAYETIEELRFIDIQPEDIQNIDIAVRGVRGGCWYAWNNDSYKSIEYPDNILKEDGFFFRLSLNGANVFPKTICFKFLSVGNNGKPEFARVKIPQPPNTGTSG